jgi:hypothetical protein
MNFLFPYLVGGAVVYVLFCGKKTCPPCAIPAPDDAIDATEAEAPPVGDLCALVREAAKGIGKLEADLPASVRDAMVRLKALRDAGDILPAEVQACLPKTRIAG